MKCCKNITAWTDYPFVELGDEPNKIAPIRQVLVTSYDGDKYATVIVEEVESSLKCGYLYIQPGRLGSVKTISQHELKQLIPTIT